MPSIEFGQRNFFVQNKDDSKTFFYVNTIDLHNGIVSYDANKRGLSASPDDDKKFETLTKKREEAIDILAAPKLNACHFILIKSKSSQDLFAIAHINPSNNKTISYINLFQKFPSNDKLDIIFCGGYSGDTELLLKIAEDQGYAISSQRIIPFCFNVEQLTFFTEPKSVHFYFIPSEDQLIIFSDNYIHSKKPAIHIAQQVFENPSLPLIFHQVDLVAGLKDLNISAKIFCERLPVFTKSFLSTYPKFIAYTHETCPDEVAATEQDKLDAALKFGHDFTTSDGLTRPKQEFSMKPDSKLTM